MPAWPGAFPAWPSGQGQSLHKVGKRLAPSSSDSGTEVWAEPLCPCPAEQAIPSRPALDHPPPEAHFRARKSRQEAATKSPAFIAEAFLELREQVCAAHSVLPLLGSVQESRPPSQLGADRARANNGPQRASGRVAVANGRTALQAHVSVWKRSVRCSWAR